MNILFLDIGGVLNEGRENEELYSRERIQQLNNLLGGNKFKYCLDII